MGNLSHRVLVRLGVRRKSALATSIGKCSNYHVGNKSVLFTTLTGSAAPRRRSESADVATGGQDLTTATVTARDKTRAVAGSL